MTLLTSLVEVKTIACDRPRSEFDEQEIEQAARSIVEAEGIINPIILSRTGINSFEVVNGHFEYYAAARAKEIDLAIGETIAAYIIDGQNEAINKQVDIFRKSQKSENTTKTTVNNNSDIASSNLENRLNNIESRIENRLNEIIQEHEKKNKDLEQKIKSLSNKLPEKIEPLATFNQASLSELTVKLKPILSSDKKTNDIADKILQARPFESLSEVLVKTKGLGDKTMVKIIDRWLYSQ